MVKYVYPKNVLNPQKQTEYKLEENMEVYSKCSDYASDACPCELAENGCCIVCSMCRGEDYCSCTDTVSFCVYQDLINNGGKARPRRRSVRCQVTFVKKYGDDFRFIRLNIPDEDTTEFKKLGAYVFVRTNENPHFDTPISVLYDEQKNNSIGLLIQMQGIKTNCFRNLQKGDSVYLRGPYFNGIQGRKVIAGLRGGSAAVFCRGIGFLPSLGVILTLKANGNKVDVYLDRGNFNTHLLNLLSRVFEVNLSEVDMCDETGKITDEMRSVIDKHLQNETGLLHFGMSDYLIKNIAEILDTYSQIPSVSFINNVQMCCGEGICGACTRNIDSPGVVHLCKEQLNMEELKKIMKVKI